MTFERAGHDAGREPGLETGLGRGHGVSVWRQIADAIEADIAACRYPPSSQLPTEAVLSARFGVNRHTVRRALATLTAKGAVRSARGLGTFVEARPILYPIASRTRFSEIVARGGRDPGGLLVAAETVPADAAAAAALGIAEGAPVLCLTTLRSADGVPISFARSHFPLPRFAGLDTALTAGTTLSDALGRFGAADYRRAVTRITGRLALADEAAALELAPGRMVMVVDSVNVDGGSRSIQQTRSVFAADRVEFLVES